VQEAQDIASRTFSRVLEGVDPAWLRFSIAVRYKRTGERKEIPIAPESWLYVTSRLVPYRTIDVHVVPPPSPQAQSSSSTSSSGYAQLYPDTPPPTHHAPLYHESDSPSRNPVPLYAAKHLDAPSYPDSPRPNGHAPLYPDTPPPMYPVMEKEPHPFLAPSGYGYGFGWSGGAGVARPLYGGPGSYGPYESERDDGVDRLSRGWSINGGSSVGMTGPPSTIHSRSVSDPVPFPRASASASSQSSPQPRFASLSQSNSPALPPSALASPSKGNGLGLFSSIRQKMFPGVTWAESRGRSRRRRRNSHSVRFQDYEDDEDLSDITSRTRSPRSYVPSLI